MSERADKSKRTGRDEEGSSTWQTAAELETPPKTPSTWAAGSTPPDPGDEAAERRRPTLLDDLRDVARSQLRQRPYTVIAAALGGGYVLAAGFPRWAIASAVRTGIQAGVASAAREALASHLE